MRRAANLGLFPVAKDSALYDEIIGGDTAGGIAACIGRSSGTTYDLYTAVYDPVRGQWMPFYDGLGSRTITGTN